MPFKVTFSDGKVATFKNKPSPEDIEEAEAQLGSTLAEPEEPGLFRTSLGEGSEFLKKARIPAQTARQGGQFLRQALDVTREGIPDDTVAGKVKRALLGGAGKVITQGSKSVASLLEPESAVIPAALRAGRAIAPAVNAAGRFIAKPLERLSGLAGRGLKGVLAETTADPSLFTGAGLEKAREAFVATKQGIDPVREGLRNIQQVKKFITESVKLAKQGKLNAVEALEARKALDQARKKLSPPFFRETRILLDDIAKTQFKGADKAFQRAIKSEALREVFPSGAKGDISQIRTLGSIALGGLKSLAAVSPGAQGLGAAGIGVGRQALRPFLNQPVLGLGVRRVKSAVEEIFGGDR